MFTIDSSIIGDNSTDNSAALNAWISALGGAQASAVFPPGTYKITGSNVVFPSNVGVTLQPGAVLSVASGKKVTFTGDLVVPHSQQVFVGPGQFQVNSANLKSIDPRWWGAKGDTRFNTSADNGAIAVNATTFTSASLALGQADVNKTAAVFGAGPVPSTSVTGVTNVTTAITVTVASTSGLFVGQQVVVSSITGFTNPPNGTVTLTGVFPNASQITYTVAVAPTGTYGGGGTVATVAQTISACTNSGTSVTATVASTAAIKVGQTVLIQGVSGFTTNSPNGLFSVATVPSGTTFTFTANATPTGTYTANSGTVAPATWWISTVISVSSNTATVSPAAANPVPANTTYIRLGTDDSAAIQAAIVASGGGTKVFLAPAIYTVKSSIESGGNESITLEGVQPFNETNAFINDFTWANASGQQLWGTWISYVGTGYCFGNGLNYNTGLKMRDIGLLGTGLAGTTGLYMRQLDSTIDRLLICNFDTGVDVAGIISRRWSDISCRGCNIGHSHGSISSTAGFLNISTFVHLSASHCGVALRLIHASTNVYIGLDVESCNESTVGGALGNVWLSDDGAGHGSVGNKFQTAWCEDNGGVNSFYIGSNCAGNTLRDIQIVYPLDAIHVVAPNNDLGPIRNDGTNSSAIVIDATATGTRLRNIASTITLSGTGALNVIYDTGANISWSQVANASTQSNDANYAFGSLNTTSVQTAKAVMFSGLYYTLVSVSVGATDSKFDYRIAGEGVVSLSIQITLNNGGDSVTRTATLSYSLDGGATFTTLGSPVMWAAGGASLIGTINFATIYSGSSLIIRAEIAGTAPAANATLGLLSVLLTTTQGQITIR